MYAPSYIWAKILNKLEEQFTEVTVSAWLEDAQLIELTETQLVIAITSPIRRQAVVKHCLPIMEHTLSELTGKSMQLLILDEAGCQQRGHRPNPLGNNAHLTFDNFVAGPCNRLALCGAEAAANTPGDPRRNPLFLYGPPGVGKTHLLYAVANRVLRENPQANVVIVRTDQFTGELIEAIRHNRQVQFRQKYRQADVLLMDDIQFIAGKEATQEAFFQVFNELFEQNKQIVVTADRSPLKILTLQERLQSRFNGGLLVQIDPPDWETRLSIIRRKSQDYRLSLDEACMRYLADNMTDNVRQIEGALKLLRLHAELLGTTISPDNIGTLLEDLQPDRALTTPTPEDILAAVGKHYGVDPEALKSSSRSRGIAIPRQVAMYLLRGAGGMKMEQIAVLLDRDRTTVQYGIRKVEQALVDEHDPVAEAIVQLQQELEQ